MKFDNSKVTGDLVVNDDLAFHGLVTGSITVNEGARLEFHGACSGKMMVLPGARVNVYGRLSGNLINSGDVRLEGVIGGSVVDRGGNFSRTAESVVSGSRSDVS
jgi:cytoskeletal protein CcmA (bactofilin family)